MELKAAIKTNRALIMEEYEKQVLGSYGEKKINLTPYKDEDKTLEKILSLFPEYKKLEESVIYIKKGNYALFKEIEEKLYMNNFYEYKDLKISVNTDLLILLNYCENYICLEKCNSKKKFFKLLLEEVDLLEEAM